tara:strand:+ start:1507 stop:2079 length:573 start_codon:yes stop_codon:yes gene_type:complete
MLRLILLVSLIGATFAASNSHEGHSASWLTDWLIPHPGLFFWTLITFFIVLLILRWKAWGPLMNALEDREKRINEALSSADKAKQEAEKVSSEYDQMIAKAQAEAQEIVSKGKEAGENLKNNIENRAKEESEQLIEKTKKEINSVKSKAIEEIKSASIDLAIQAATKVVNKNMDDSINREIAKVTIDEAN